jgi:hypothetical protein
MGPVSISFEFRNKRYEDAGKGLEAFAKELTTDFKSLTPVLKRELKSYLEGVALALQKRHGNPYPGGTGTKTLSVRSGRAMKSIGESIKVTGSQLHDVTGGIGGVGYLRTHEHGATIKPKTKKYLAIPLPAALNSNGTPKRKGPRDWDNTFIGTSKKGNLLIFRKEGAGIVPLYVLVKQVTIKPRLGMGDTLNAGLPYFVDKAMEQMLKEVLK